GVVDRHGLVEDDVEDRTLYLVWETVPRGHADEAALDVLGTVLSNGRGTRLDDALYYGGKASGIGTWSNTQRIAGQFVVVAKAPELSLPKLEKGVLKEVARI